VHSWLHTWSLSHQRKTPVNMKFTSLRGKLHFTLAGHHHHVALKTVTLPYLARSVRCPQAFPVYPSYYFPRVIANAAWATSFPTDVEINFIKIFLKAYSIMRSRCYCTRLTLIGFFRNATRKHTSTLTFTVTVVATRKARNFVVK